MFIRLATDGQVDRFSVPIWQFITLKILTGNKTTQNEQRKGRMNCCSRFSSKV